MVEGGEEGGNRRKSRDHHVEDGEEWVAMTRRGRRRRGAWPLGRGKEDANRGRERGDIGEARKVDEEEREHYSDPIDHTATHLGRHSG